MDSNDARGADGTLFGLLAGAVIVTLFTVMVLVLLGTAPAILFWLSILGTPIVAAIEVRHRRSSSPPCPPGGDGRGGRAGSSEAN